MEAATARKENTGSNTDSDASVGQLVVRQESSESFSVSRDEGAAKSALENTRDTPEGGPRYRTMLQKIRISSGFFRASIFAARIPFVSAASAGDDFSNNLFSDLAPILALFGEQVAKQYMSQSMSERENLIFACAPLGIITAMSAAIRVGGPRNLLALIGRARESRAVVEVELMSSTSADVCELWDGQGVVRVLGPSPVIELYYLEPGCERRASNNNDHGIWNFKEAVSAGLLKRRATYHRPGSEGGPNIGLNLSSQPVSGAELACFAWTGLVVQAGVIVFAGAGAYLPTWKKKFEKDGKEYQKHAFPLMACGTVALVLGMFICCHIVERSTTEHTWVIKRQDNEVIPDEPERRDKVRVAWLQKGGEVNDQHFKSYILSRGNESSGDQLRVRTSHREISSRGRPGLTIFAVTISLTGFVMQFVGLRGMAWQVTIAQLAATGAMTVIRARVRRNLVHEPKATVAESGYELDAMAMEITGCREWNITTWPSGLGASQAPFESTPPVDEPTPPMGESTPPADESTPPADESTLPAQPAKETVDARRRLGALSRWPSEHKRMAETVAQAIEASVNFLLANPDVKLKGDLPPRVFQLKLFVETLKLEDDENDVTRTSVELNLSRRALPNGAMGPWKADKGEIEAVLGLWMLQLKTLQRKSKVPPPNHEGDRGEDEQAMGISGTYRIVGSGHPSKKVLYKRWLLPQTELAITETRDIVGRPNPGGIECLAVFSETSLEKICGQHIFSTVLANVVHMGVRTITGKALVGGGSEGTQDSLRLSNTVIDGLLEMVVETGLAATGDALLSIVPAIVEKFAIENAATTETFSALAEEISAYLDAAKFEHAEVLLLWLLHAAESAAEGYEKNGDWPEACKAYILLWKACYGTGCKNYARRADEAAGLFRERFRSFNRTRGKEDERAGWDDMKTVLEGMQIKGNWLETNEGSGGERRREGDGSSALSGTACDTLLDTPVDVNSLDSMGRTPLVRACLAGLENIAIQLLRRGANPCLNDRYRRTAIHYAAMKNDTSALHALLLHEKAGEVIDARDRDGASPLELAVQNSNGPAIALLLFYGAEDPGSAKELQKLSTLRGSCAAIKKLVNLNLNNEDLNRKDPEYGRTLLHWAIWRGGGAADLLGKDKVEVEVEAQGNDGLTALHLAACRGCDSSVKFLIEQLGADAGAKTEDEETALYLASARGHDSTVELLFERLGADVTAKTEAGNTALHRASAKGHDLTVVLLTRLGADVNAKTGDGETALHLASAGGHDSTVELLIERFGVDVNAKGKDGATALHLASAGGHDSTVELLIRKHRADMNARAGAGETALHRASAGALDNTMGLLIQLGADKEAKNETGETALHLASARGHGSTIERLVREFGADVDAKTGIGETALHRASAEGQESTVKILIEKCGADLNAKTEDGQTALHLACKGGHDSTIRLLIERPETERLHVDRNGRMALHLLVKYMYVP